MSNIGKNRREFIKQGAAAGAAAIAGPGLIAGALANRHPAPRSTSLADLDTDAVFVEWDRNLMWVGTGTGIYLVTSPLLGKPVLQPTRVSEWSIPGLNHGHA
jgi:hypothetical protein